MRHRLWANRLQDYIESVRANPYDGVTNNCALFVSGAIGAMTGETMQERLGVGPIESMRDVAQTLKRFGGVRGLVGAYSGHDVDAPLLARRGDVVVKPGIDGDTLGVCMGDHALFLGPDGLQPRQLTECVGSWRID